MGGWIQKTPYTWTKLVEKYGGPWLKVCSSREGAPFGPGHTSVIPLRVVEWKLQVGNILDVDPKKGKQPGRQLTGGMLKLDKDSDTTTEFFEEEAEGETRAGKLLLDNEWRPRESFIDGAREEMLAFDLFLINTSVITRSHPN